jgi:PAS domain S-box-containing protein
MSPPTAPTPLPATADATAEVTRAAARLAKRRAEPGRSDEALLLALHVRELELEAEVARLRAAERTNEPSPAASVDDAPLSAHISAHISNVISSGEFGVVGYWDDDFVCRYASRSYLDWFGLDPRWMIGRCLREVFPTIWTQNRESLERARAGVAQTFEQEVQPPGFPRRVVWTQYLPDIEPASGAVRGIVVMGADVTAMREAQAAQRQSEAQFSSAFHGAPIGMALLSLDGTWLQVNRSVCEMFGYSESELREKTFQELTYPDDLAGDLALVDALLAGKINEFELGKRYVARDGHLVHAVLTVSLLRYDDGSPRCFLSQIVDVSARLRIEARDARRAEALTLIATGSPLPVVLEQLTGGVEEAYPTLRCSLLLVSDSEAQLHVGAAVRLPTAFADWINLTDPRGADTVGGEANWATLQRGESITFAASEVGRSGGVGDAPAAPSPAAHALLEAGLGCVWALPIRGTLGNLLGVFALHAAHFGETGAPPAEVVSDVGSAADLAAVAIERWRAHGSLLASRRRYEDLVQSVQGIVWEAEADTFAFTFVSAEAERLLGYPQSAWLEDPSFWENHIHQEDRERAVSFCVAQTAKGLAHRFEYRMIAADGRVVWLEDTVGVIHRSGQAPLLRGVLIDITDRKRTEDEIRELNASLEERIVDRTAQLTASNRELAAFTYAVSHDLRAPLRRIDGWSRALIEDCGQLLDEVGTEHLARVRSEAGEMTRIIDDLLRLSRFTQSPMRHGPVDLAVVARTVARRLSESEPERALQFRIADEIVVTGDAGLLTAAVTNLLENAWKFTSHRTDARIEVGPLEAEGTSGCFVRDNGAGFDPAYANKLFAPFQRLHKSSEFPGFGIGLATVQRIITRHGGRVWGEGAPGAGATFSFSLPQPHAASTSALAGSAGPAKAAAPSSAPPAHPSSSAPASSSRTPATCAETKTRPTNVSCS